MSKQILVPKKQLYVKNFNIVLFAFSTAFFVRIFCSVTQAPSALNHLHLVTVPFALAIVTATTRIEVNKQIAITWSLLFGLVFLFGVMTASALLNEAGFINVIFLFLMLGEPFMLLTAIVCLPMSPANLERLRNWIIGSSFANMILAFIQWFLLKEGLIQAGWQQLDETDGMAGVFFVSGAGNYVSATVSMYFGLYYLLFVKKAPVWLRGVTLFAAFLQLQLSDSKQVLFALFVGWVLLVCTNLNNIRKALLYAIIIIVVGLVFYWCIYNVEAFGGFRNYLDKEGIYGPDGAATQIKTAAFRIIPTFYHSFLNSLLGLGPGHTVGRLGGWLIQENWNIFGPLGATVHPASQAVLNAYFNSWIAMESTMYCPLFGWAGIWGDLGFLGLAAYLYLWFIVWRYLCFDNFSQFLVLSVFAFGLIFTQMEEPGYMLYTTTLIGLRWHEHQCNKKLDRELRVI
jgi:hypothetical protein